MPPCLYVAVILGNEKYCEPLSLKRILNTFVLSISKILSGLLIQAQSRKYGVIGEEWQSMDGPLLALLMLGDHTRRQIFPQISSVKACDVGASMFEATCVNKKPVRSPAWELSGCWSDRSRDCCCCTAAPVKRCRVPTLESRPSENRFRQ